MTSENQRFDQQFFVCKITQHRLSKIFRQGQAALTNGIEA